MTDFCPNGTLMHRETWADNELIPLHDNEDSVCGIQYNGSAFYFLKNLQGDVIALTDGYGNPLARYTYDAWGKLLSVTDKNGNAITSAEHIAHINPYRYRGYYYDREIGMYYLQSRYYSPIVGRFVNSDESLIFIANHCENKNLFSYCESDPINKIDQFGFASYKNTKNKKQNGVYNITSVISGWWTKLTYKYQIDNGVIRFAFDSNAYWSVLWRGWAKTLATAMYKAAKSISSSYLKGRTITGLHIELFAHWALYKVGIKPSSTKRADMGGCWGTGYDSNAWVFEAAHIISRIAKINISNVWAYYTLLRDIARYF